MICWTAPAQGFFRGSIAQRVTHFCSGWKTWLTPPATKEPESEPGAQDFKGTVDPVTRDVPLWLLAQPAA